MLMIHLSTNCSKLLLVKFITKDYERLMYTLKPFVFICEKFIFIFVKCYVNTNYELNSFTYFSSIVL